MRILNVLGVLFAVVLVLALVAAGGGIFVFSHYGRDLPQYDQLTDYEPPTVTRVHAGDGRLLAEYARQKRVFVPVEAMPKRLINAFLTAEDKNFFSHFGVDPMGILRAGVTNLRRLGDVDRRPVGGSTITQQVAKNFLLSNEVSIERKIKEAILAIRIERALDDKNRILELYLNEIYLGYGSYGVAAAALNYFNTSLDKLDLAEIAYLAALPKAPSNYDPVHNAEAAKVRRDWVIGRMLEEGFVTAEDAALAKAQPLEVRPRGEADFVNAPHFAEEVRRELFERYGEKALYEGGMSVRTTMDPRLQAVAEQALRDGLIEYDQRHGWRGPIGRIALGVDWPRQLAQFEAPPALGDWRLAVVLGVSRRAVEVGLEDATRGFVPLDEMIWARPWLEGQSLGPQVTHPRQVVARGDIIAVEVLADAPPGTFGLRQIPEINGAVVALDPHTGRVLALAGGYRFEASEFNRATQALRQPGSSFKPFVYAAALQQGFTPSSLILDAPFVIDQGPGLGKWKPANYTRKFYGPSTLRLGIEKSRNLMTVRLAQYIGIESVIESAVRFGIVDSLPPILSMALGAGETTLMRMTAGYAMFVNGGKRITPTLIDRIQDRRGRTVLRHDDRPCRGCVSTAWRGQLPPAIPDSRATVVDPTTAYQVVSLLEGVVRRGTGRRIAALGIPLAGKTGTTNESKDTWFIGFSPDLAVGVYVGFDEPISLGRGETGSSVAAPIFKDVMAAALGDEPAIPFRIPSGVRLVRVSAATGLPAQPGDQDVIFEAFRPGTEPDADRPVLDGSEFATGMTPREATSGLY
jgi:penicillin-binding protein 1A